MADTPLPIDEPSTAPQGELDGLTPFVFEHAPVRGAYVRLAQTTREILAAHPYPVPLRRVLAELLGASALLSSTLKFEGSLIVQLSGDGPVRLLVVECTDALELRATAQWDSPRTSQLPDDATLADLAGGAERGRLVITLDPKGAGSIYQGIVALEATSVAALIEHYLATSEQLASRLVLHAAGDDVAGLLVQRLPGESSTDAGSWTDDTALAADTVWKEAGATIDALTPSALLQSADRAAILSSVFPDHDVRMFRQRPASFRCSCSRERVENALRIAGAAEIESILAERGEVDVTCEFCNHRYVFAPPEARAVFAPGTTTTRH